MFAEFLPPRLVFPVGTPVWGQRYGLSVFLGVSLNSLWGWDRLIVGGGSVPTYTYARRRSCLLITHFSIIALMGA